MNTESLVVPVILLVFSLVWIALFCLFGLLIFAPWMKAQSANLPASLLVIARLRLTGRPVGLLLDAWEAVAKTGHPVTLEQVEAFYLRHRKEIRSADDLAARIRESTPASVPSPPGFATRAGDGPFPN